MFSYECLFLFFSFFFLFADDGFSVVRISLGKGHLHRCCLIECKQFFSIYGHVFNTIEQDRFHTHAFNAIAILIKGGYEEEVIGSDGLVRKVKIGPGIRYIPRSYNHRLLKSEPNTLSLLFAGPWYSTWTEENDQYIRTLTWGRKELSREMKPTYLKANHV